MCDGSIWPLLWVKSAIQGQQMGIQMAHLSPVLIDADSGLVKKEFQL